MPILFFIFILTPIIEISLFIKLGGYLGLVPTIALVFLTAIVGVTLLRIQGMATLLRAKTRMAEGRMPAQEMAEGILLAVAGAFLLTPGFFTDTVGFILLFPPARRGVYAFLKSRMTIQGVNMNAGGPRSTGEHTFEGEFSRDDKTDSQSKTLPPQ